MRRTLVHKDRKRPSASGFTLIEVVIAASLMAVMGLALGSASMMGNNAHVAVLDAIDASKGLRAAGSTVLGEFRSTDADTIAITTLADGNHEVSFMLPITVGGLPAWGVYDPSYGPTAALQNKLNWRIRYTVKNVAENGTPLRKLVRQVLDTSAVVQEEETLVNGLRSGVAGSPGFSVTPSGEMWKIEINTEGYADGSQGEKSEYYVRTRN